MLEIDQLHVAYGKHEVLEGVSLTVATGRVTAIIGPNGAGKSTLLRTLCGLVKPITGQIRLHGKPLAFRVKSCYEAGIAYLPQELDARAALTALEVVLLGRVQQLSWRLHPDDLDAAWSALATVDLTEFAGCRLTELSGGQRQLVYFAQTLVRKPSCLLLDEPSSALDLRHELVLLEKVRNIAAGQGAIVLIALHDLNTAARFADHLAVLHCGRLAACGTPHEVLTEALLAQVYGVQARVAYDEDGIPCVRPLRATKQHPLVIHERAALLPPVYRIQNPRQQDLADEVLAGPILKG